MKTLFKSMLPAAFVVTMGALPVVGEASYLGSVANVGVGTGNNYYDSMSADMLANASVQSIDEFSYEAFGGVVTSGASASANASARSGFGSLGVKAVASSAGWGTGIQGRTGMAFAESSAFFSDSFTISSASLSGQGFLVGSMLLSGSISGATLNDHIGLNSSAHTRIISDMSIKGSGISTLADEFFQVIGSGDTWGETSYTIHTVPSSLDDGYGAYDLVIPVRLGFTFNVPVDIHYSLWVSAIASALGNGAAYRGDDGDMNLSRGHAIAEIVADYSHTLLWGGIGGVEDEFGNTISLASIDIQSDSGFNYRYAAPSAVTSAVPTPPTSLLLGTGLLCLAGVHGRRKLST